MGISIKNQICEPPSIPSDLSCPVEDRLHCALETVSPFPIKALLPEIMDKQNMSDKLRELTRENLS